MSQEEWWKFQFLNVQPDKVDTAIDETENLKLSALYPAPTLNGNDADRSFASLAVSSSLEMQSQAASDISMASSRTLEGINMDSNFSSLGQQWSDNINPLQYAPTHHWDGFYYVQNTTPRIPTSNYHPYTYQGTNIPFADATQLQVSKNCWNTHATIATQSPMKMTSTNGDAFEIEYGNATAISHTLVSQNTVPKKNKKNTKKHDCHYPTCQRKGKLGFTRHDNLITHLRGVHGEAIPKKCQRNQKTLV